MNPADADGPRAEEPFVYEHRVRLEEVDAGGIVFFPRYFQWCHQAMAAMLESVEGGYAGLLLQRGLGLPTVHAEADYAAPLRFGDGVRIAVTVERIGTSSSALRFDIVRAADGARTATLRHVVVMTDVKEMRSRPLAADVRSVLARHHARPGT